MWPGQPAGDGVDAEPDVDAALAELAGQLGDAVLGLGDRHAVAGGDDHASRPSASSSATPSAVISRCSP